MARAKKIFCIVAYDINDDKNRGKVAKILETNGVRINYSVFECMLTISQLNKIKDRISVCVNGKTDTVVYYQICVNCFTKTEYLPEKRKIYNSIQIV